MDKYDVLIGCSSWEDRFIEGLRFNLSNKSIEQVLLFSIKEFTHLSKNNIDIAENLLVESKLDFKSIKVSMIEDHLTWKEISNITSSYNLSGKKVLLDISTMPRFLIWFLLHFLVNEKNDIHIIYFRPKDYCNGWLSADPLKPRLIFKHSGIFYPDQKTVLIIQTGFDAERISPLLMTYEPEKILLAAQTGKQFNNVKNNIEQHKQKLSYQELDYFEIDSDSNDRGFSVLENKINEYHDKNVILVSFGPKPVSIEIFKLNYKYPEIGLAYVPCRQYNEKYSVGIDLSNILEFKFEIQPINPHKE